MLNKDKRVINELKSELEEFSSAKRTIELLETQRAELKREVIDLKSQKKIEEQEIKHLVKIKDEKREIEFKRKEMELESKYSADLAKEKDKFQDKQIAMLDDAKAEMSKIHCEILKRLPKFEAVVNVGKK